MSVRTADGLNNFDGLNKTSGSLNSKIVHLNHFVQTVFKWLIYKALWS